MLGAMPTLTLVCLPTLTLVCCVICPPSPWYAGCYVHPRPGMLGDMPTLTDTFVLFRPYTLCACVTFVRNINLRAVILSVELSVFGISLQTDYLLQSIWSCNETPQLLSVGVDETPQLLSVGIDETPQLLSVGIDETPQLLSVGVDETPQLLSVGIDETPQPTPAASVTSAAGEHRGVLKQFCQLTFDAWDQPIINGKLGLE